MSKYRFLFDECAFGIPAVKTIRQALSLSQYDVVVDHLLTYFPQGTPDGIWIPKISDENWVIITADRGKRRSGLKLPKLCLEYHITHVLFSRSVNQFSNYDRMNAFHDNLDGLVEACNAPRGTRFHIRRVGNKHKSTRLQMDAIQIPSIKKVQKLIVDPD